MFKQIKRVAFIATLLMLNTSVAYSSNCTQYTIQLIVDDVFFDCRDAGDTAQSTTATWNVADGNYEDTALEGNVGYCNSATDTTCLLANRSAHLNDGEWLYVKNTSGTDYYKAQFIDGTGFQNAQAHNPAPTATAVPLSPLSKLLLALLFMGASLMMLKRKGAKV